MRHAGASFPDAPTWHDMRVYDRAGGMTKPLWDVGAAENAHGGAAGTRWMGTCQVCALCRRDICGSGGVDMALERDIEGPNA